MGLETRRLRRHVGPLYWDTVQSAAALISPAGLLPPDDVRVQGYLDVLEDRLLLENHYVGNRRRWFDAGWQYQGGLERTANMHLAGDDIPVFLRSFLNCYAIDILPSDGYVFNEHAVHGPPDKTFEEAAFLERFRNMLVMEDGTALWLARGHAAGMAGAGQEDHREECPHALRNARVRNRLRRGKRQDPGHGRSCPRAIRPGRCCCGCVIPRQALIKSVTVNGRPWTDFDAAKELIRLHDLQGTVQVEAAY